MKKAFKIIFSVVFLALAVYVSFPSPKFPAPLPDALQSDEPADTETPWRRAYFTNATRAEVVQHYQKEFGWGYRLNYPPEEARTLIRDQTRSTFLEEVVHPLRESLYINGFEPKDPKDAVIIAGRVWRQKIIVRYVPSHAFVRIGVVILSGLVVFWLFKEIKRK